MTNIKLKQTTPAMVSLLLMELTISFIGYRKKREGVKIMKIYGNGSVEKKGKDKYLLRVVVDHDETGKPVRASKMVNATGKREAERKLRDWISELEAQAAQAAKTGNKLNADTVTLGEAIHEYLDFLDETQKVRPHTIDGYAKTLAYPERALGGRLLKDITFADMEQFYRDMKDHGGKDGGPLGANTVSKIGTFTNAVFKRAVQLQLIPYNPIANACPFKVEKPKKTIMSEEEVNRLIARLLEYPRKDQATAMLINTCCGTRRGETCALTWQHVDFDHHVLNIVQAATQISKAQAESRNAKSTLWLDKPKTANGTRSIPIPDVLYEYLLTEKEEQRKRLEYYGYYQGDDTPVCATSTGKFMQPSNMSKFSKTFLIDNGFDPSLTLHSLRHSYVTHLLDRGYPPNQIGQISGQSPLVVMNTYGNHRSEVVIKQMATELNSMMYVETVS
ncbi:MAG: site-specific integrase [Coriobacteriales bacterium]|jgi:integrase|nr:site-specific integrase [Coriobacteriales bacterium]